MRAGRRTWIELRDPVHGPIAVTPAELGVIDTPVFQRLRGIKQLGFAEHVFPGAVHHRYLHSIGALHIGGELGERVFATLPYLSELERRRFTQLVRLAALLHDIGHPPMSHAAEALLPSKSALGIATGAAGDVRASHEDMTQKLLLDSVLTKAIDDGFGDLGVTAQGVADVLSDDDVVDPGAFVINGIDHRPLLHAMVSGEMDVDRMDYLLRDSFFTGVRYGHYDRAWLMSNASAIVMDGAARLALDMTALPTFEHFLLARYHMFQMVYFHPKSDIYDAMLRRWLDAVGDEARFPASSEAYTACDDAWLWQRLRSSDDRWARAIVDRKPPRLLCELRGEQAPAQAQTLLRALADAGVQALHHRAKPVLSRYAQSPAALRTNPLYVIDRRTASGATVRSRIEDVTDLFSRYDRSMAVERLYVSKDDRAAGQRALEAVKAAG